MTSIYDEITLKAKQLLDEEVLFNYVSGFLVGGFAASWLSGLVLLEGTRAFSDLLSRRAVGRQVFILALLVLLLSTVVIFGAILHHHIIVNFGSYVALDRVYPLIKYHFVLCRLSVVISQVYFINQSFHSLISHRRSLPLLIASAVIVTVLFLGNLAVSVLTAYNFFKAHSYYAVRLQKMSWRAMFLTELVCDLALLILNGCSMFYSNEFSKVTDLVDRPVQKTVEAFLLSIRTPMFNTALALVSTALVEVVSFGTRYSMVFLSAQIYLWVVFSALAHPSKASPHLSIRIDPPCNEDSDMKGFPGKALECMQRLDNNKLAQQRAVRTRSPLVRPRREFDVVELDDGFEVSICPSKPKKADSATYEC